MEYGIANYHGQVSQNEVKKILDLCFKNGIFSIDTAKAYGNSEQTLGHYIKKNYSNSWEIITKTSTLKYSLINQYKDSKEALSISPRGILAHSSKLFLKKEFQNQLHELLKKYPDLKIGVSVYTKDEILNVLNCRKNIDIIQIPINIIDTRLYHDGTLKMLHEQGIKIFARSVFLQGLFFLNKEQLKSRFKVMFPAIEKLQIIAKKSDLTLSELSLLWVFNLKEIYKLIIGVDTHFQLQNNIDSLKKEVNPDIFNESLSVKFNVDNFLNPSMW